MTHVRCERPGDEASRPGRRAGDHTDHSVTRHPRVSAGAIAASAPGSASLEHRGGAEVITAPYSEGLA